ncbi:DUF5011 domain-containing protein [Ginsengibacter hankyongi]|uniref:DUF5011 domain-containing protein n=1 Tax=Ginsengibacter hankyongi TaxID=2607284 RepID=A0A5J5IK63_9BACT|nr:DUF5011 domain-containing protein [Ginsengibacter hankyongi]KAA9040753.1 DUF5011 domain-containing protein [Ginsengibacter hankyongi]
MKKRYLFLLISFLSIIASCSKDKIINTHDRVGISKVTYYPILTLTGNAIVAIPNGTAYTDPGVKAQAAGVDVPVTTSGTVDVKTDGVYTLTYSAVNSDGYSASATRKVVVYTTAADAAANDLSGNYARTTNGSVATWTKIAPGVYTVFNPGGAPGTNLTVVAINPSGFNISIPEQLASDGSPTSSTNESYTNSNPAKYSWKIVNPGYGTGLRTFIKQ